jgi:hypothetical protein
VSTQNSRKTFLAQLLGVFVGIGFLPKLFAGRIPFVASDKKPPSLPFAVQAEPRAVARTSDAG